MAIFLVRHGETAANAERVLQLPETPLSVRGMAQAQRLARRLAREGTAHILSSDLARAAMTAEPVRTATGASLAWEPLLEERSFGDLRGTPYAELPAEVFAPGYTPPGGESWETLHARVDVAWLRIRRVAARAGGHLAVVTHGLVCRSLVTRHLALGAGAPAPVGFDNSSVTLVEAEPPYRVRLLNCTAHLDPESRGSARSGRA